MSTTLRAAPRRPADAGQGGVEAKRDWPAGLVLGTVAVGVLFMSWRLGITHQGSAGPGLWPLLCGCLLLVCAAGIALGRPREPEAGDRPFRPRKVAAAVGLMLAFVILMTTVGVVTSTVMVAFSWLRFIAFEGWRLSLVLALSIGVTVYLVFIKMLDIPLPLEVFLPR